MDAVLDEVFQSIQDNLRRSLEAAANQTLGGADEVGVAEASGTITVPFQLDSNGNYTYETSKYGAGVTVSLTGWFDNPDATYSLKISSSDGGGGSWSGLSVDQQVSCKIDTSFWSSTKITVAINASVQNQSGQATIKYSY